MDCMFIYLDAFIEKRHSMNNVVGKTDTSVVHHITIYELKPLHLRQYVIWRNSSII